MAPTSTSSFTFRLDVDSIEKLRSEANNLGISLNSLVNRIIREYLEWYKFEPKLGFVPIAKSVVEELFTKMGEEQIIDMATRIGKSEAQNAIYFMKGKIDVNSFLSWFENRMKNSSIQISHTFNPNTRTHTYVIKHDISINWSLYLKIILERTFEDIIGKQIDVNMSYHMLTFKFKED